MKWNKPNHSHGISEKWFKHVPNKLRQYASNMFSSLKCKNMTHGAADIVRLMNCAHGENWRRNHPKNLNKQHKK